MKTRSLMTVALMMALVLSVFAIPMAGAQPPDGPPGLSDEKRAYACRQDIHPQDENFPGVHVASLAEAPNGDILYSFYAGTREQATDVATYMSRLALGQRHWTVPEVIFDEPNRPDGNAVLWVDGPRTWLFFSTIMGPNNAWTQAILRRQYSDDSGFTWSEPAVIREEWGWLFGTRPFRMSNGEVIVPIYSEIHWAAGWYLPSADYETWIPSPSGDPADWPHSPGGAIQPATVELEDGHLLAFMRTRDTPSATRQIYRTESFDYGRTWTPAVPAGLPNNNARVDLLKLEGGALLLASNPITRGRSILRLQLSDDGGETWSTGIDIENESRQEFSYPYTIQTSNGEIHFAYTHRRQSMRHVVFNEAFLRAGTHLPSNPLFGATEYRDGEVRDVAACHYVRTLGRKLDPPARP